MGNVRGVKSVNDCEEGENSGHSTVKDEKQVCTAARIPDEFVTNEPSVGSLHLVDMWMIKRCRC